jgi:hypothetical protein
MLEPRVGHSMAILGIYVYAIGGSLDGMTSNCRCERYNLEYDNWDYILPLNTERMNAAVCTS